jgi:AraC-like DNA-binding protein
MKGVANLSTISEYMLTHPIVPYIRQADYPIRPPYRLGERRLLDYLLIFIESGNFELEIGSKSYILQDGDYCLIQPNVLHAFSGNTETITPYAHFDIFYSHRRVESFPTRQGQIDLSAYHELMQPVLNQFSDVQIPHVFRPSHPIVFRDMFVKAIQLWQEPDSLQQQEASILLAQVVLQLLREFGSMKTRKINDSDRFLEWIESYMSFHLADPLSIQVMANRARLSPSRFSALFRQHFGMSPHRYLLKMRINHAKDLLMKSKLSISQIAEYCGFTDIFHFSKMFSQYTSVSPSQYRKETRDVQESPYDS